MLVVAAVVVGALSARADADILKLFGEVHGGGVYGKGLTGDPVAQDKDFFSNVPHGMYGARIGARFLILDAVIQHHQFTNGSHLATWTQFGIGIGIQSDLGDEKAKKAKQGPYVDFGVDVGFGLGTGRQVDPPLSNDEVTDKGFLIEGRLGFGKHLNSLFDLGVAVPASWGYFFKNGFDVSANDLSTHYRSFQIEGLVYLRMNLKLL
ncbi:MAG TPA: hypothetical protein VN253_05170 [Kofleriaceae bacterium]|nr:hypothetical protein [Kofleriaceae bacterium]